MTAPFCPVLCVAAPPSLVPESSASSSDDAQVCAAEARVPKSMDGARLVLDNLMGINGYRRYNLVFNVHKNCRQARNLGDRQQWSLGEHEPLGYLGAWLQLGKALSRYEHAQRGLTIHLELQRQWLRDHGYSDTTASSNMARLHH